MIQFDSASAIYLQVADYMAEKILTNRWAENERIPPIREVAATVQVNPNTVVRSYAFMQDQGIIFNRRGVGYFVAENGRLIVQDLKRSQFIEIKLPRIFREAALLELDTKQLQNLYQDYLNKNKA